MPETLEEHKTILTRSGYKEYPKQSMLYDATAFYQKRISDEKGVKFFIDCYLYKYQQHGIHSEILVNFRGVNANYRLMEYAKDSFDLLATELLFLNIWQANNFNYSKTSGE